MKEFYLFHVHPFVAEELLGDRTSKNMFDFSDSFHEVIEEFSANLNYLCIFAALNGTTGTVIFFSGTGGM